MTGTHVIVVGEEGCVFLGTYEQYQDTFGYGEFDEDLIREFCEEQDEPVEIHTFDTYDEAKAFLNTFEGVNIP